MRCNVTTHEIDIRVFSRNGSNSFIIAPIFVRIMYYSIDIVLEKQAQLVKWPENLISNTFPCFTEVGIYHPNWSQNKQLLVRFALHINNCLIQIVWTFECKFDKTSVWSLCLRSKRYIQTGKIPDELVIAFIFITTR